MRLGSFPVQNVYLSSTSTVTLMIGTATLPVGASTTPTPTLVADFVNGVYTLAGAATTADALFQSDDWDGDPWTPEAIQPGVGYVGPASSSYGASFKGAALPDALANSTLVIEFTIDPAITGVGLNVILYDDPAAAGMWQANLGVVGHGAFNTKLQANGSTGQLWAENYVNGVNRAAFSYSDGALVMSVNGGPTHTLAGPAQPNPFTTATLYFYNNIILRSVARYTLQPDADLPALSAP